MSYEWNGHPGIFSLPQPMETSRQDLPLRTDISQKTDESLGAAEDAYLSTCLNNQKPYKNGGPNHTWRCKGFSCVWIKFWYLSTAKYTMFPTFGGHKLTEESII